jgi:hypothetical protein
MWATSVIFEKLPKENNRPLGENSPFLVTLPKVNHRKKLAQSGHPAVDGDEGGDRQAGHGRRDPDGDEPVLEVVVERRRILQHEDVDAPGVDFINQLRP